MMVPWKASRAVRYAVVALTTIAFAADALGQCSTTGLDDGPLGITKDGIEFDIDVAYFTCNNSDCCDFHKHTPMNQATKKPITDLNEISVRIAVKKCE